MRCRPGLSTAVRDGRCTPRLYRFPGMPPVQPREAVRVGVWGAKDGWQRPCPSEYRVMVFLGGRPMMVGGGGEVVGPRVGDVDFLPTRPVVLRVDQPIVEVSERHMASRGKTLRSLVERRVPTVPWPTCLPQSSTRCPPGSRCW